MLELNNMIIVGISAYSHDAACCLLQNGTLLAAALEERFTRRKHEPALPRAAFRYCLVEAGLSIADIDCVAYYEDPIEKLSRQLWMGARGLPACSRQRVEQLDPQRPEREIRELLGYEGEIEVVPHHLSHAASAFYFSGFAEAAILTVDGVGEWATTTYGHGRIDQVALFEQVEFPNSLGLLYNAMTSYLGFEVNDGEYKVMGLAPYGEPRYVDDVRRLIRNEAGGQFTLDLTYFDFFSPDRMFSPALPLLFGQPPRARESELRSFHCDIARSTQVVLEEILLQKVKFLYERHAIESLCMAGGVALNCVANRRILREGPFRRLFVQPAANDAGGALGAAAVAHHRRGASAVIAPMRDAFLGPAFGSDEVLELLAATPITPEDYRRREPALLERTAVCLAAGQVVAWVEGRMEFGPRALGARSILADPRDPTMRERVNLLVKKREAFRPFAPAVLAHRAAEHFDLGHPSPFMTETCRVTSALPLPAVTHVDGSARVQTVPLAGGTRFARLLAAFERLTGCPILLNTSFNLRDEPIVCSPADALTCFLRSEIDVLVMADLFVMRAALPAAWLEFVRREYDDHLAVRGAAISHRVYTFV